MKKLAILISGMFLFMSTAFAGGLLTNLNQSAQFIRTMSRNASLDIDAVYYNPAGLIKMEDGFHFAFYSQSIFQDKNVNCEYPLLNDGIYKGTVSVPVFPTAFAVYKKENWAFSAGFGPNAGGGSAKYDKGLPSFETQIAALAKGFETNYNADLSLEGTSIFWGIQLGATYKINDVVSVYGGVRYLPSVNTYKGNISNIQLLSPAGMIPAKTFLAGVAGLTSQNLQPIISGGGGVLTIAQAKNAKLITAETQAKLEGGLKLAGAKQEEIDKMPISTVQALYSAASQNPSVFDPKVGDKHVDTKQTGTGFTPMIGINISPNEDWNFAVKYEHTTYLTLTNKTTVDDLGLFPDGATSSSNVPAILGIGVGYKGLHWMEVQLSYDYYFNKNVDWGMNVRDLSSWKTTDPTKIRHREIDKNGYEAGLGLQFNLTDKFGVSVGGLLSDMGVAPSYQSDFSWSNPSTTIGGGAVWKISKRMTLDAGISNTFYKDQTVTFSDPVVPSYKDTYSKTTLNFAVGIAYKIY